MVSYFLELTNCEYDMNNPNGRMALRQHLMQHGFFEYPENKPLWPIFEQSEGKGEDAKSVFFAMQLFNAVKMGHTRRADANKRNTNR